MKSKHFYFGQIKNSETVVHLTQADVSRKPLF